MLEFRYDTQLLIEGENLDEDAISEYSPTTSRATACWLWGMRAHQDSLPHQRTLEGTGILRFPRGNLRYCSGGHGPTGQRAEGIDFRN